MPPASSPNSCFQQKARKILAEYGVSKFGQQLFFPEQAAEGGK